MHIFFADFYDPMLSTEFCMATKGDRICRISWVFLINFQALEGFLAALVQCIILMFVWARYVANWFAGKYCNAATFTSNVLDYLLAELELVAKFPR